MENEEENINTEEEEEKRYTWKFWTVLIILNIAFLAVIARLFFIQIIDADRYKEIAQRQHEAKIILPAKRGKIFDRNGIPLTSTVQSVSVGADPKVLKHKFSACKILERITGVSCNKYLKKINSADGSFVWLERGMMPDDARPLEKLKDRGLLTFKEPKRIYFRGPVGSQIVGAANVDNKGISGIEKAYDTLLSGRNGYVIMQRDASGHLKNAADLPRVPPINGKSLMLTIDIRLQEIIEYELKRGVWKYRAESGTAVAINPRSGEVLAMASYPNYNPNNLSARKVGSMRNRAITDLYEPGSTFKIVTAAAALEEDIVKPTTILDGKNGELNFVKYIIRDDHPVGKITFAEALEVSSNVIFSQIGDSIPKNKFYKYVRDFGFGNSLGIDLIGEVEGKMQKPSEFNPSTRRFLSHGYGIAVTPLQMVSAFATTANDGILTRPFVVKSVIDENGKVTDVNKPLEIRRVITEATSDTLTKLLVGVVENGTGELAKVDGLEIAGKTGTAKQLEEGTYETGSYMASYGGYLPAGNPRMAMLVAFDNPEKTIYGGKTAAPVFRRIVLRYANSFQKGLNERVPGFADSVRVPRVEGYFIEDAKEILYSCGLEPKVKGEVSSWVARQTPKAGELVEVGESVAIKAAGKAEIGEKETPPNIDVSGLTLRKALRILHKAGVKARVKGEGIVAEQKWSGDDQKGYVCVLICERN